VLFNAKVARILKELFDGYNRNATYLSPLLAYTFVRGDDFVRLLRDLVLPMSHLSQDAYLHSFIDDGLTVVRRSEDAMVARTFWQGGWDVRQAVATCPHTSTPDAKVETLFFWDSWPAGAAHLPDR
jgi:hypothetical protein